MSALYSFGLPLVRLLFRLNGAQISGRENIPDEPAVLLICNHVSYGDPVALAAAYPRQLSFIAKEDFSYRPLLSRFFAALGAVFLRKNDNDLVALRTVIRLLQGGRPVVIFPEGHRNAAQELAPFQPGAAYIAMRAHTRVLPVAVVNTGDTWRFWRRNVRIRFGAPFEPPAGRLDDALLARETERYQQRVAELLAQEKASLAAAGKKMQRARR